MRQPKHAPERARLRDMRKAKTATKEAGFAFCTFRHCVTRHKRGTKQQDEKREKAQDEPQQSKGVGQRHSRLSRAKVARYRARSGRAGGCR